MPVATVTSSAAGSLHLLEDDDQDVRVYALNHLLAIVPQFWAEISDKLTLIELLAEPVSKELPAESRPKAALLISKVYFYIGELNEAVEFALRAGTAFESEPEGEYKETIVSGCMDRAIRETEWGSNLDPKLQAVVDSVLRSGGENGKLVMGLALSLRRLDLIEMIFLTSRSSSSAPSSSTRPAHDESLLRYVLHEILSGYGGSQELPKEFVTELFALLLRLFSLNHKPDYNSITSLWVQSDSFDACGEALASLLKSEQILEAYQIGFDVAEVATQAFVEGVRERLKSAGYDAEPKEGEEVDEEAPHIVLNDILRGVKSAELFLNFLSKNNKTDLSILKVTKESLEDRYSIYHSAITFTNAFANCGTTSDKFLRENLDWLGRASNWAKFSTTAALGVIHRGSWVNGLRVVKPYLPGGASPNLFSEAGALFALGLIYAGRREGCEEELKKGLAEGNDPIVQHGAALGLGISALATADEELYEEIRTALFQDNATTGEAAGYAMGLIMLGTESEKVLEEMTSYARETQHEKIIRSLAIGRALVMYGAKERASKLIVALSDEKDAIMRYGGMFTIALAYVGTGDNYATKLLLHYAVSDVNDDVRRAAVTGLGFVLFRNYQQVPRVVQLLAESYNPHVRHGATLALGISCAGTGLETAVELLEPLTKDPVDFVRQGAFIALAMIFMQQSEAQSSKVASIRQLFGKVVSNKREDPMARFGASLAQGIIDAGGRNMNLSLSTRAGTLNMNAIVGLTLFCQFWYWYPLAHGLGLALSPTAVIAVDEKLRVPQIDFTCHAKPSTFAYPSEVKKEVEKKETKAKLAMLSTTAKARAREKTKKEEKGESMDTDDKEAASPTDEKAEASGSLSASGTKPSGSNTPAKSRKPAEASSFSISNMSRVTPLQQSTISLPDTGRYLSIRAIGGQETQVKGKRSAPAEKRGSGAKSGSIILLRDNKPEDEGTYIELDKNLWPDVQPEVERAPTPEDASMAVDTGFMGELPGGEADMPAPFEYPFDN